MKKHILLLAILFIFGLCGPVNAQKIEYNFGEDSDVVDSIKSVINWFKSNYHGGNVYLYVGIDFCGSHLNLYISEYKNLKDNPFRRLAKASNRIIKIDEDLSLPVIFQTDVLSTLLIKERIGFFSMGGYYLRVEKNDRYVWKVASTSIIF